MTPSGLTTATESGTNYYGPYSYPYSWNWPDKDGEGDLPESLGTNDMWVLNASGSYTVLAMWLDDDDYPAANPPAKLTLRLDGNVNWLAPINYATVSGTGADDGLKDPVESNADAEYIGGTSRGTHLRQYDSSSGVVTDTISQSASVTAQSGSDQPDGWDVFVGHYLDAMEDNRGLTLSSIQTYHKNTTTGDRDPDGRDPDGTLEMTSIYSCHSYLSMTDGSPGADDPFINTLTFSPNFSGWDYVEWYDPRTGTTSEVPNVVNPDTWNWSPSNGVDYWDSGVCQMRYGTIYDQDGEPQGAKSGNATYIVNYTATDNLDGATASANANVALHDQWENKANANPATTLHEQRTYAPGNAGVSNNSGVKFTTAPTWTASINASVTLGFSFSPSFDVAWAKILGISVSGSGTIGGTFSISVPGPLLDPNYATYPFILTTWQTDNYLVDSYTISGFDAVTPQSADDPNSVTNTGSWAAEALIGTPPPP